MNRNKIRTFLEIIYNCPFVLLVIFTSVVFLIFFDGTEGREDGKNVAALRMIEEKSPAKENDITDKEERKEDSSIVEEVQKPKEQGEKDVKNAGTRKENTIGIKKDLKCKTDNKSAEISGKQEKEKKHATEFVEYTPIETDSRYYSDAGKIALTTVYDYVLENESYFNDAAFLGDSRTLGISDYAGLEGADFFCDNGMTIYKLLEDDGVTYQKTGEKVDMKEILQEKHYGKIYIMLGMNELGYGDTPMYLRQYLKVIRQIKEWQPGVIIYVMANLHVSQEKNNMETEFNNININDKNVASARLANGSDVFYLDCNPLFTDEEGYLLAELTFDGVHLYAQHYDKWRDFLFAHGVEREEIQQTEGSGQTETSGVPGDS